MHTNATNKIDNPWPNHKSRALPDWCLSPQIERIHGQLRAPVWAKALFVARSGGADTLVWAASRAPGCTHVRCTNVSESAMTLVNPQRRQRLPLNHISLREGNSWVLVGYRDEPEPDDVYTFIAAVTGTSRGAAKARVHSALHSGMVVTDVALSFAAPEPSVGVKPRNIHDEERANALDEAMVRYLDADLPFPVEWATEWNELRARLNKEQP